MQSWSGAGQNGDARQQWQGEFNGYAQPGQFADGQTWQQMPDQNNTFELEPQPSANFFEVNPHEGFLDGNVDQGAFQPRQDPMALRQQYQQPHNQQMEGFGNINPQLYAQQGIDATDAMAQQQGHTHAHFQPSTQQAFEFQPQNQQVNTPNQRFVQPHQQQLMQQHQQSQSPASFEHSFAQQGFSRPPQQSPVQQGQQMYVQQQPGQPTFAVNGHQGQFQNAQAYQQVPQASRSQTPQQHPGLSSFALHPSQQPPVQRRTSASSMLGGQGSPPQAFDGQTLAQPTDPSPKKRKRVTKAAPDAADSPARPESPVPADLGVRAIGSIDGLAAPASTPEEVNLIAASAARPKTAQAKQPQIKGLPHLAFNGSVTLPAPKSYDKLTTMVALPSRSGKGIVPELGRLPCEIQGQFTNTYRPGAQKSGLDERRAEAKPLLDQYEKSMKALGKRRPKYTEYPHAFREQLKSDEATKSKAEKKAKKDAEQIRPPVRPTDLVDAAAWDAIGFTHIESGTAITTALIGTRVQQTGDFLVNLRGEMTRAKQSADQAITDKVAEPELSETKQVLEQKREALYKAFDAILEHGHDRVLDNLGGHHELVLSMINTLIGCIKAGDFSGKLPKAVLELFTMFNMTKKIAETTNFDTIRKRFAEKGDKDAKELVSDLNKNIKKIKAAEAADTGYSGTSAASRAKAKAAAAETSTKRARDDDADTRTTKKVAMESGGSSLSKKLAQPKAAAAKPATSIMPGKSRPVAKPAVKPEAKEEDKKPAPKDVKAPPPPKMGGSSVLSSLLDSINAPKAEAAAAKEAKDPEITESPEEKAKRLRKEARRKLRVSWKPEAELVQVKIFEKDDNEDEGREVNMVRDAADDHAEGMVLRQRASVDDDDDDDDIPYQPWTEPTVVDFSALPEKAREKNYITRGGVVSFTTDEQKRITEREQRELMAIYTDVGDIPETPKSPAPEDAMMTTAEPITLPQTEPFNEIHTRWRESQQLGVERALYTATQRLDAKHGPSSQLDSILSRIHQGPTAQAPQRTYQLTPLAAGSDAEKFLLGWLQAEQTKNWRGPQPASSMSAYTYSSPESQIVGAMLEAVARRLADKPYPATNPPEYLASDEERVREWWFGFNKEAGARQRREEDRARSTPTSTPTPAPVSAPQPPPAQDWTQQQEYAPYLALLGQINGGPAAAPLPAQTSIPNNELQSMLAAINHPQAQPQSQQQAQSFNPMDPTWEQAMVLAQMMKAQAAPPPPHAQPPGQQGQEAWDRERDRDRGWDQERDRERDRDWDDRGHGKKKKATLPPHKPVNKNLIGTKPCTFWQQGKCARGDKCTFRHD